MANLSIRKVDPTVYHRLQQRAAAHHISTEEEIRRILYQAVMTTEGIASIFKTHFGEKIGVDLEQLNQRTPHLPMDFTE